MDSVSPSQWMFFGQSPNHWQKLIVQIHNGEKFPIFLKLLESYKVNSPILRIFPVFAAKGRTYLSIADFRNATPIGSRQNLADPMCPGFLAVVFDQCAGIKVDQRRSSIMIRESGFPLTLIGGVLRSKRPFFKGNRIFPCFARIARRSSTVASASVPSRGRMRAIGLRLSVTTSRPPSLTRRR